MPSRSVCAIVLASAGLAVSLPAMPARQGGQSAADLLARARQALGGEARLASVRSFIATGSIARGYRTRVNHGSFRVASELPDRFVSTEAMTYLGLPNPGVVTERRQQATLGFNGRLVIYEPAAIFASSRMAPPSFGQAEVGQLLPQAQLDFVRLTLGMFATSFSGAPVTFSDAPGAARGRAVVVQLHQRGSALLEFDPITHLPARFGHVQYFDFRDVDGVKVPFRIVHAGSARSVNEWRFDRIRFDVDLPGKLFKAN